MFGMLLELIDEITDKEKFSELYKEYKDMMYYKAMGVLHNHALAEEAVQDSFFKIAKNISKVSQAVCSKTAAYIVIIVRNTCLDIIKKEKNYLQSDDSIEVSAVEMPNVEEVISECGFNGVVKIVGEIDKIYSDALKLKYIYGFSAKEIANLLDITEKTAQIRLYRGKLALKEKLKEEGYVVK